MSAEKKGTANVMIATAKIKIRTESNPDIDVCELQCNDKYNGMSAGDKMLSHIVPAIEHMFSGIISTINSRNQSATIEFDFIIVSENNTNHYNVDIKCRAEEINVPSYNVSVTKITEYNITVFKNSMLIGDTCKSTSLKAVRYVNTLIRKWIAEEIPNLRDIH